MAKLANDQKQENEAEVPWGIPLDEAEDELAWALPIEDPQADIPWGVPLEQLDSGVQREGFELDLAALELESDEPGLPEIDFSDPEKLHWTKSVTDLEAESRSGFNFEQRAAFERFVASIGIFKNTGTAETEDSDPSYRHLIRCCEAHLRAQGVAYSTEYTPEGREIVVIDHDKRLGEAPHLVNRIAAGIYHNNEKVRLAYDPVALIAAKGDALFDENRNVVGLSSYFMLNVHCRHGKALDFLGHEVHHAKTCHDLALGKLSPYYGSVASQNEMHSDLYIYAKQFHFDEMKTHSLDLRLQLGRYEEAKQNGDPLAEWHRLMLLNGATRALALAEVSANVVRKLLNGEGRVRNMDSWQFGAEDGKMGGGRVVTALRVFELEVPNNGANDPSTDVSLLNFATIRLPLVECPEKALEPRGWLRRFADYLTGRIEPKEDALSAQLLRLHGRALDHAAEFRSILELASRPLPSAVPPPPPVA